MTLPESRQPDCDDAVADGAFFRFTEINKERTLAVGRGIRQSPHPCAGEPCANTLQPEPGYVTIPT